MESYASHYYGTGALPIPTGKGQYQPYPRYYTSGDSTYSVSPPEEVDVSVSSVSGMSSYGNTGYSATTSYAGSTQGDYESAGLAGGIDLNEYMHDRFAEAFSPLPLDRCMVTQAQTSGHLNAKQRELIELQAKAQSRLAKTRARFAEGLQDAREVRSNLEWTQKKLSTLKTKASKKHPKEYAKARARYPSPDSY